MGVTVGGANSVSALPTTGGRKAITGVDAATATPSASSNTIGGTEVTVDAATASSSASSTTGGRTETVGIVVTTVGDGRTATTGVGTMV